MKKKLILIIVAIIVVVGGIMMMNNSSTDDNDPKPNNQTGETNQEENNKEENNKEENNDKETTDDKKEETNVNIDKEAKATYDALVKKLNTEVDYFVSEYDMAGNLVEYEMFKADEHVVSVGRIIDGIDEFIYGLNFSFKDKTYDISIDESFKYAYTEADSEEKYTGFMYSDFFENPSADVVELTQSKKDDKTIIEIHAVLDIEDTTQYLIYLVTVNKDGLVDQEEMIVADKDFNVPDGADSAVVKFHSYNKKDKYAFADYIDVMKSCKGKYVNEVADKLKR